jgi:SET domain-containing protein
MIGYIIDGLEIKYINEEIGYGVFTNKKILKNTIIENSYCISIKSLRMVNPEIQKYIYGNKESNSEIFLALGYGSLYNHSDFPNIKNTIFWDKKFIEFTSINDIEAGEQLTWKYREEYWQNRKTKKSII